MDENSAFGVVNGEGDHGLSAGWNGSKPRRDLCSQTALMRRINKAEHHCLDLCQTPLGGPWTSISGDHVGNGFEVVLNGGVESDPIGHSAPGTSVTLRAAANAC